MGCLLLSCASFLVYPSHSTQNIQTHQFIKLHLNNKVLVQISSFIILNIQTCICFFCNSTESVNENEMRATYWLWYTLHAILVYTLFLYADTYPYSFWINYLHISHWISTLIWSVFNFLLFIRYIYCALIYTVAASKENNYQKIYLYSNRMWKFLKYTPYFNKINHIKTYHELKKSVLIITL